LFTTEQSDITTPFDNDIYAKIIGQPYVTKINNLERRILKAETGEEKFVVLNVEAGVGKSIQANRIIADHLVNIKAEQHRNFLVVKRFKEDVKDTTDAIGVHDVMSNMVLGITSDNWKEWMNNPKELRDFRVLIITHERYISLCLDKQHREVFTEGRHTQIIDEKINLPVYSFSEEVYRKIQIALPFQLQEELIEVCKPLYSKITQLQSKRNSNNECIRCKPEIDDSTLIKFIKVVNNNWGNIDKRNWNDVRKFLITLKVLYSKECLYNGGRITSFNREHKLWGLKNNIILDGNGEIDYTYKIADYIKIDRQSKIIDHSNSTLYWIKHNSSASYIRNTKREYLEEVCRLIREKQKENDKTLIITHKEFEKTVIELLKKHGDDKVGIGDIYNDESLAVDHFGNLIGKNIYRNFTQCWVIGTPNIPMETHLIHWMQYAQRSLGKKGLQMVKGKDKYGFKNEEFEKVRMGYLIGEFYQCIKRIQRNPQPQAEFFIITNDEEIVKGVTKQMKDIKQVELPQLIIETKKGDGREKRKNEKVTALVKYLLDLPKGEYPKSELCEKVGINPAHFSRYRHDVEIKKLEEAGLIVIKHTSIIKL
jgi:hypothetical protein